MPNWCNNNITISGDEGTIRTLTAVLKGLKSSDDNEDEEKTGDVFKALIGTPPYMSDGEYEKKWYETNIDWFGTKWDINYCEHSFNFSKEEINFSCETAWSPPIAFMTNLCKMYKVSGNLFYSEGGVGFAGETTFSWLDDELDVFDQEYEYFEGLYKLSNEEFWAEVDYRVDCILDEEMSLEDFLSEFEFVTEKDKEELTRLYNETIENNDEDDDDTEGE
jgi:hypothetical protein